MNYDSLVLLKLATVRIPSQRFPIKMSVMAMLMSPVTSEIVVPKPFASGRSKWTFCRKNLNFLKQIIFGESVDRFAGYKLTVKVCRENLPKVPFFFSLFTFLYREFGSIWFFSQPKSWYVSWCGS